VKQNQVTHFGKPGKIIAGLIDSDVVQGFFVQINDELYNVGTTMKERKEINDRKLRNEKVLQASNVNNNNVENPG
jgi:hypothetical protein